MFVKINFIRDITSTTMLWHLKVRVVRLWAVPDRDKPENPFSLEMILQDEKGDRIHATIGKSVIRVFRSKIIELGLYSMKNFLVGPNNLKFKTTNSKFKLTFMPKTTVEACDDSNFHMNIFNLRPYDYLINAAYVDTNELFDVIGEVISYSGVKSHAQGGNISVFMNVELQNHDLNKISATFWGEFVDQILPYLNESGDKPVIVVMQLIRAHKFLDKLSVRNTWHTSKLWINSNLPQVTDFKSRLLDVRGDSSIGISQISSQNSVFSDELASGNLEVKTIEQLVASQHEGSFWIVTTVVLLQLEVGWSYVACKKCTKKVKTIGGKLYCEKCDCIAHSVTNRYRIQVQVMDASGFIGLLLWDREATKLIGKSANELKESLTEAYYLSLNFKYLCFSLYYSCKVIFQASTADFSYPSEMDTMLERKLMFKVYVKSKSINKQDEVYNVVWLEDDEDLIKNFERSPVDHTSTDPNLNNEQGAAGDKEFNDSMADNVTISPMKTHVKRSRSDNRSFVVDVKDQDNAQLSSNRVKRPIKKGKK